MVISVIRLSASILMFLCATAFALAQDAKMIPYFTSKRTPPLKIRNAVLEGIVAECPKAVKLFEFHDESYSFVLLKLSENSYATKMFYGNENSLTQFLFDAENLRPFYKKDERQVSGKFKYQEVDPEHATIMTITHNWTIFARDLDLKDTKKVFFCYQFAASKEAGSAGKKVTIAVDWKAGRVEGVKVVPLTGKENGLEP